jgi:hypothetical protein
VRLHVLDELVIGRSRDVRAAWAVHDLHVSLLDG